MEEKKEEVKQTPVAGMKALAFGVVPIVVFALAVGFGMLSVTRGKALLLKFSSPAPLEITYEDIKQADYDALLKNIHEFVQASEEGKKVSLLITATQLNSLVLYDPSLARFKGHIKFYIREKILYATGSLPLEKIEGLEEKGKGRYLNGECEFRVFVKKSEGLNLQLYALLQEGEKVQVDALDAMQLRNSLRFSDKHEKYDKQFELVKNATLSEDAVVLASWLPKKK